MNVDSESILTGDLIDRLRRLELFSRRRVEGNRTGENPSPLKGFSSDFLQHRQYFPGDSLKYLDWRVMAKSDRLVVKQFEELTNTPLTIILDVSASMGYPEAGMSKLEYSVRCAAILFYIAYLQQDTFSLYLFNDRVVDQVPHGGSRRRLRHIFEKLVNVEPHGQTVFEDCVRQIEAQNRRKGMVVIFSDFMDDPEPMAKTIGRLRLRGHDVIAFQIVHPAERELDFVDFTRFRDMESDGIVGVDPLVIRDTYQELFDQHQTRLRERCLAHGLDFDVLTVDDTYETVIGDYLRRRMALMR